MIFGTFDIVHAGHIHMIKEALRYGNRLIAIVARDINVKKIKGKESLHTEYERVDFLKELKNIDEVELGYKDNQYRIIEEKKPDVIALGYDQKIKVEELDEKIVEMGLNIKIVRLKAYKPSRFKSGKIKEFIEKII